MGAVCFCFHRLARREFFRDLVIIPSDLITLSSLFCISNCVAIGEIVLKIFIYNLKSLFSKWMYVLLRHLLVHICLV